MKHLTQNQLQEYADGFIDQQLRNEINLHLHTCDECGRKMESLRLFESSLKNIPLERVDTDFTGRVMKRLRIQDSPSIVWWIFKNLAPIFGLIFIIGIVYSVLKFTGTLENSGLGESITATQSAYNSVATEISTGVSAFNEFLKTFFPFLYTKSSYGMTAFLVVLFIIVAILDKFIFSPLFKKRM